MTLHNLIKYIIWTKFIILELELMSIGRKMSAQLKKPLLYMGSQRTALQLVIRL